MSIRDSRLVNASQPPLGKSCLAGQGGRVIYRWAAKRFSGFSPVAFALNPPYSSKAEGIGCVRLKAL